MSARTFWLGKMWPPQEHELTLFLGLLAILIAAIPLRIQEVPAAIVDEAVRIL